MANAPLVLGLWAVLWELRPHYDKTRFTDLVLFLGIQGLQVVQSYELSIWRPLKPVVQVVITAFAVLGSVLALWALSRSRKQPKELDWEPVNCQVPLVHRCLTIHSRMFPKKHSFSYKYLQVSVPVEFEGNYGKIFSVKPSQKWALFQVDPTDYLERHDEASSLKEKLAQYLESQDVPRDSWHHAYLVTAPKFLGYSFNPVSFWYIYDHRDALTTMILEVNNTFGERRMYLLKDTPNDLAADANSSRFRNHWEKDFHVSPFNSRKGHYSLSALNPFRDGTIKAPGIDNNIVLTSSKSHAKLVARLLSDGSPLDLSSVSTATILQLVLQWCWLGIFTFPRIIKEAFVLFFQRKLHVWLRPEVVASSASRAPNATEMELEKNFIGYMKQVVSSSQQPVTIILSGSIFSPQTIGTEGSTDGKPPPQQIEIRILSPEFFTRMVHYHTILQAIQCEGSLAEEKSRTIEVSLLDSLSLLLTETKLTNTLPQLAIVSRLRWTTMTSLRCTPPDLAYSRKDKSPIQTGTGFSVLDEFVISNDSEGEAESYRRIATKLFLAKRLAFGLTEVMDLLDFGMRVLFTYYSPTSWSCLVHLLAWIKG
ncbi:DUF1365-domain-containing protein [Microthyrium microscopicum]|uniref:DUF1365-domain-containing protein n=1 Tax=Microthyrium microscopicum TaxID=703497 RepID=A0A6A6TUG9_9PEZI|nr:DUF1365-domain-containing protein [Microthyrium microscopicum]